MTNFPWRTGAGLVPLGGALGVGRIPSGCSDEEQATRDRLVKRVALAVTVLTLAVTVAMAAQFKTRGPAFQFTQVYQWIPQFGVHYAVGVDGIALVLILMTTILMPVVVLASWNDADAPSARRSVRTYFMLLLVLETMMIGVFAATDVFLFYVFFEAMLVPM